MADKFTGTRLDLDDDGRVLEAYGFYFTLYRQIDSYRADIKITAWGTEHIVRINQDSFQSLLNPDNPNDKINWYTSGVGSGGAQIYVKPYQSPLEPTLIIDNIISELSPAGDVPAYNRYGVYLEVHLSGTGKGNLKISWGNDLMETKTGIIAGNYAYIYNLPPGTHNVCAELFNVV